MRLSWIAAAALALAPALASAQSTSEGQHGTAQQGSAPTPKDRGIGSSDTSERGSRGSQGMNGARTGPPAAGVESGQGEALGGGRTDEGPAGGTGIRASPNTDERRQAKLDDQARGANRNGSLLRPADSPADMNRDPKAMGSGAPNVPPGADTKAEGQNYGADHPAEGRAGGIASGEDNPGASSPAGISGKAKRTQPENHKGDRSIPHPEE